MRVPVPVPVQSRVDGPSQWFCERVPVPVQQVSVFFVFASVPVQAICIACKREDGLGQ